MVLSHKDQELPNSRIWLAGIDIDRGLNFLIKTSIYTGYILRWKSSKLKYKNIGYFLLNGSAKKHAEKKKSKRTSKLWQI